MKEKKYIHRKVTNQSDFLIQLPYMTGVLVRTRKKQRVDGWKSHAYQTELPRMLLASNKQASNSRRREMRVVAFLSQNDSGSCLWGPMGACHPHLGLHCYEAISLFTYTVRWNTKMSRFQVAWFPSRRICRRESWGTELYFCYCFLVCFLFWGVGNIPHLPRSQLKCVPNFVNTWNQNVFLNQYCVVSVLHPLPLSPKNGTMKVRLWFITLDIWEWGEQST